MLTRMFGPDLKEASDKELCGIPEASYGCEYQAYGLLE
jgi:hypothetical protein